MMTSALTPGDFRAFFEAVYGVPPFPWQARLLREVAENGEWPAILDLPTGSGKTAALDIAVFHLALEAQHRTERRAPVRIAYVVDRRLIVDDAYGRAERLQKALANPVTGILKTVAAALQLLAGGDAPPLLARRLRGGTPREDDWARTPVQPTILCSTVDQVGSRLLFRGYGISDRMKPIHAGLLGADCLILLDEAHLAEPFRQTLDQMEPMRDPRGSRWRAVTLTATPWEQKAEGKPVTRFQLGPDDCADPLLNDRLTAVKPAALVEIAGRQGVAPETRRIEEIAERTKEVLKRLRETISNPVVGVVVNRVLRARAVFDRLKGDLGDTARLTLVIGPARSIDRDTAVAEELRPIRTDATRDLEQPLVIVATQTIEAGVDIDLDGLVTEVAPLDALRQRFGRLNRAGRPIAARGAVLAHRDDIAPKADDPVYGASTAKTWRALQEVAEGGVVDFGFTALRLALPQEPDILRELASPKPDAPVLMPAYADLWSQTSPVPKADPDVALFLHGPDHSPASVQIVWRADMELQWTDFDPQALLSAVPPKSAEAIEVSLGAACAWLGRLAKDHAPDVTADFADLPEIGERDTPPVRGLPVYRWAGRDDRRSEVAYARNLRPNDLVVAPAAYGGCDAFGWNPNYLAPVYDAADEAAQPYLGRRYAVRVSPSLIEQALRAVAQNDDAAADPAETAQRVATAIAAVLAEMRDEPAQIRDALYALDGIPSAMKEQLALLAHARGQLEAIFPYGEDGDDRPRGVVLVAPHGLKNRDRSGAATPYTEDDDLGSFTGGAQTLKRHSGEVAVYARRFGRAAGLSTAAARAVTLAAWLHDAGKADPRFQALLGADPWAAEPAEVLAKSSRGRVVPGAASRPGLPPRWRHEALSVRLALQNNRFEAALSDKAVDPELVLWLVGVHHGWGRPFFPHIDKRDEIDRDDLIPIDGLVAPLKRGAGPQSLTFDFGGRDWAQIFEELKRRYGIWGLALLEAFVRLADHRASAAAERRHEEQD